MNRQLNVHYSSTCASTYPIHIGSNLLKHPEQWMPIHQGSVVILTDHRVKQRYADALQQALKLAGFTPFLFSMPPGEKAKNIRNKCALEEQMFQNGCNRETLILALGGGVVGDLAGFIAATYMRGIPYIHIPTTLLSMLDSSVGGKTGINTAFGKNLIGAFWQPKAVITDVSFLKTLPQRHVINGLVEAVKMFITSDQDGFVFVEKELDNLLSIDENTLTRLIERAVQIKADVVLRDEKEAHERVILNFGHTIGHALEHLSQYRMLHGHAVGLGILLEAKIAEILGMLPSESFRKIQQLFKRMKITPEKLQAFSVDAILQSTRLDKKVHKGDVRYVLINTIGSVYQTERQFAQAISDDVVRSAYQRLKDEHDGK